MTLFSGIIAGMRCTVAECDREAVARTWCRMHWKRWKRNGDPTQLQDNPRAPRTTREARFWAKVDKSGGENACWLWTASRDQLGYGFFRMTAGEFMWRAHRASWVLTNGEILDGVLVCHVCDNPPCVNPKHLYLGDNQTNSNDRVIRNRSTRGRPVHHGELSLHKLTLDQVREIRFRYAAGRISQAALGCEYNISQTQVSRIICGKRWQHDH